MPETGSKKCSSELSELQGPGELGLIKEYLAMKSTPAAKKRCSVPVSIPMELIVNKNQLDRIMKHNQAILGKHKLPFTPPSQRKVDTQPHGAPRTKPTSMEDEPPNPKITKGPSLEMQARLPIVKESRIVRPLPAMYKIVPRAPPVIENVSVKPVMENKAIETDHAFIINASEENLISYVRAKKLTCLKVMSIISAAHELNEKRAEQGMQAATPTTPIKQNCNDLNSIKKILEAHSDSNKAQALSYYTHGVKDGKQELFHELFGHEIDLTSWATNKPTVPAQTNMQTNNETEPTGGDETMRNQVEEGVIKSMKALIKARVILLDHEIMARRLSSASLEVLTGQRPPVPPLKKNTFSRNPEPHTTTTTTNTTTIPQIHRPSFNERPWPTVPAMRISTASFNNQLATTNEGNHMTAIPHAVPHKMPHAMPHAMHHAMPHAMPHDMRSHDDQVTGARKASKVTVPQIHTTSFNEVQKTWSTVPAMQNMSAGYFNNQHSTAKEGNYMNAMPHGMPRAMSHTMPYAMPHAMHHAMPRAMSHDMRFHDDQVTGARKASRPPNNVPYHAQTRAAPTGQQHAPDEYQPIIDRTYQQAQELQNFYHWQQHCTYQKAVQQQQKGSYPNTQWSNFQSKN